MIDKHLRWLAYAWLFCVFMTISATVLDYGLTWDEEDHMRYGYAVVQWYQSLFHNHLALTYSNLFLYGGLFDSLAHVTTKFSPLGVYETRHVLNALFGLVGIVGAYKLGAHLSGPRGGLFSAVFLTLMPVFYGHLFNNPKDIPFATLCVFAVYYLFLSYDFLPRVPNKLLVKLGIAIGLTLGVRIGGIILFGYLTILWVGWLASQFILYGLRACTTIWTLTANFGRSFFCTLPLACAVMLVA